MDVRFAWRQSRLIEKWKYGYTGIFLRQLSKISEKISQKLRPKQNLQILSNILQTVVIVAQL